MYRGYLIYGWMVMCFPFSLLASEQVTQYAIDRTYYYSHPSSFHASSGFLNLIMPGVYTVYYSGTGEPTLTIGMDKSISLYFQNTHIELSNQESDDLLNGEVVSIHGQYLQMFRSIDPSKPLQLFIYTEDWRLSSLTLYVQIQWHGNPYKTKAWGHFCKQCMDARLSLISWISPVDSNRILARAAAGTRVSCWFQARKESTSYDIAPCCVRSMLGA